MGMKELQREAFWKTIAVTLLGALVTGASAWLVFGQGAVTREEAARMVVEQSPYIADRKLILETLATNSRVLEKVSENVNAIKIEQVRLSERLERVLKK